MKIGTKVIVRFAVGDHVETGRIVRPRRGHGAPPPGWRVVEFDSGGRMCVHEEMLALRGEKT